jgi:prevent-host-death family protein
MAKVTAFEAKTRFGELLDRVADGEEVVITRHDKPVARLVPEGASAARRSPPRGRRSPRAAGAHPPVDPGPG